MNSKPKDTPELISQLLKSDKTIKVSDVAAIVSRSLIAVVETNPEIRESKTASIVAMEITSTIMTGIATIDMSRDEAVAFAHSVITGDFQKMFESEPGGDA